MITWMVFCFFLYATEGFSAESCLSDLPPLSQAAASVNNVYRVDPKAVRPSQFAVGMVEVSERARKIESESHKKYCKYLSEKTGEVVIGPSNKTWLVDGHHLARAVYNLGRDEMAVKVVADWSKFSPTQFELKMEAAKYFWLYDEKGKAIQSHALPKSIGGLKDDPYRSLAWAARKEGAFDKTQTAFAEFLWAQYFRTKIPLAEVRGDFEQAVKSAIGFAAAREVEALPGYLGAASPLEKACDKY
ncbi:ParB/Srx family N-terminal domain-containing protein [Bdellovibrionota bacterium FG-2]